MAASEVVIGVRGLEAVEVRTADGDEQQVARVGVEVGLDEVLL